HRGREERPRRSRRGAVHLRPGDPGRQRARRPQGEGHDPLGVGGARGGCRGAAVRSPLRRRGARRGRLDGAAEPGLARGAARLQARSESRGRRARKPLAVRAHGLLLRRHGRFAPRRAGVESHGDAQGHLGKDRAAPGGIGFSAVSCREENPMVQKTAEVEMKTSVAAAAPGPLPREELALLDAYWRASNYLSVGQIYLYDNPLLKARLQREHIKPRLLGHWGTTPG